jgi:hypothetical protein
MKSQIYPCQRLRILLGLFLPITYHLYAVPVPTFNLQSLLDASDLVIVGNIEDIQALVKAEILTGTFHQEATKTQAHIRVMFTLKGGPIPADMNVHYLIPDSAIGYSTLPPKSCRLLFFKSEKGVYKFATPYYLSLPALCTGNTQESDALGNVIAQEAAVLVSPTTKASDKEEALYALGTCKDPRAVEGLAGDVNDSSQTIQLEVISQLALRGNIKGIHLASQALLAPPATVPSYVLHNLKVGIRDGARDEQAVPELSALLQSKDDATREAAAEALRRIGSRSAIDPLVRALGDQDKKVRYQAVVGLAEINGDKDHHPNLIDYDRDESRYLEHWKAWSPPQHSMPIGGRHTIKPGGVAQI